MRRVAKRRVKAAPHRYTPLAYILIANGEKLSPGDPRFFKNRPVNYQGHTTVEKIKNATIALLKDPSVGRETISMCLIADQAGITVTAMYRFFEDVSAVLDFVWPDRRDCVMAVDYGLEDGSSSAAE